MLKNSNTTFLVIFKRCAVENLLKWNQHFFTKITKIKFEFSSQKLIWGKNKKKIEGGGVACGFFIAYSSNSVDWSTHIFLREKCWWKFHLINHESVKWWHFEKTSSQKLLKCWQKRFMSPFYIIERPLAWKWRNQWSLPNLGPSFWLQNSNDFQSLC